MQNSKKKVDNICILRTSSLGDICHMLPFVYTLKKEYPKARITWIIGKSEANFLGKIDGIDFIIFDKSKTFVSYIEIFKRLRKIQYDVMFLMQVSLRANVISLLINSKIKLGYDSTRSSDLHTLFSNKKITSSPHAHVVDVFLSFLKFLNIKKSCFLYKWYVEEKISKRQLFDKFPNLKNKYFVLSPCSRSANRNWLAERYAEVADYLIENFGLECVISSSPNKDEKEFVNNVIGHMRRESINVSGETNLDELLTLIKHSELLISPDSGPIHIATCVDKPVVGLYGVTNTVRAGPYKTKELCVDKYNDALLKYEGLKPHEAKWRFKNNNKNVMSLIQTEEVIKKIDQYFSKRSVT